MLTKCVQCGLWFWALIGLRFSQEGSVAAGKMIMECETANPELTTVNNAVGTIDETIGTDLSGGIQSCNDPAAFQTKGGKLFFAWLIISVIMCK